jgi:hypothetical protein
VTNLAVQIFADALLFSVLGLNLATAIKLRQRTRELKAECAELAQFNRDKFPMMVSALERLAVAVCPLCALAAGEGRGECEGEAMAADAEIDGHHAVYVRGGCGTTPCRAASIRADARRLFAEAFGEGEDFTIVGAPVKEGEPS